jgi:bifunctional DNase/RNase
MEQVELNIIALNISESSPGHYALVLEELNGKKQIAIIIGSSEAQSIAIHMERIQLPRPLTHDIFKSSITALGGTLLKVIIYDLVDGKFQAWLILSQQDTPEMKIDCRASDALALAVRFNCPVFMNKSIFDISILDEMPIKISSIRGSLMDYSKVQLEKLLFDVLAKEDYESATRIRDIIKKRKF